MMDQTTVVTEQGRVTLPRKSLPQYRKDILLLLDDQPKRCRDIFILMNESVTMKSIYDCLTRFEALGWVHATKVPAHSPTRRLCDAYALTAFGKQLADHIVC